METTAELELALAENWCIQNGWAGREISNEEYEMPEDQELERRITNMQDAAEARAERWLDSI